MAGLGVKPFFEETESVKQARAGIASRKINDEVNRVLGLSPKLNVLAAAEPVKLSQLMAAKLMRAAGGNPEFDRILSNIGIVPTRSWRGPTLR